MTITRSTVDMTSYLPVDRTIRYSETNAQRLTNELARLRKSGKTEIFLRPLILEVNHICSVLSARGACDGKGTEVASIRFISPEGYNAIQFAFYPGKVYRRRLERDDLHRDEWTGVGSKRVTMQATVAEVIELQKRGWTQG
jgi:hypothetical protein